MKIPGWILLLIKGSDSISGTRGNGPNIPDQNFESTVMMPLRSNNEQQFDCEKQNLMPARRGGRTTVCLPLFDTCVPETREHRVPGSRVRGYQSGMPQYDRTNIISSRGRWSSRAGPLADDKRGHGPSVRRRAEVVRFERRRR